MYTDLVFADPLGRPRSQQLVEDARKNIRAAARVLTMRFHDLRYAIASIAVKEHVDFVVVSRHLGTRTSRQPRHLPNPFS